MKKLYEWIIAITVIIVLLFLIIKTCNFYSLKKEYDNYKRKIELHTDSLSHVNDSIEYELDMILNYCDNLEFKIDSLNQVKQKIIIKKESYKINDNILNGVGILKENLECVHL